MSEANAPFNRPGQSEPTASSLPEEEDFWANPFTEAMLSDDTEGFPLTAEEISGDKAGDTAPPDVTAPSPKRAVASTNVVSISPGVTLTDTLSNDSDAEPWLNPSEPTDLADLISLIQELNQCNSILLDRVSQLEEALERSQNALKTEMRRSHDQSALAEITPDELVVQEMAAAHEQVVSLHSQLDFLHQTSQRQQILIETLTGQLESSQERIAQLEREAALVQQRYNEQSQLLGQTESTCRDLQARLHRQQRYTLQFKAALEKSLEVSSPHEEEAGMAIVSAARDSLFLPKAQQIRPWSSVPAEFSPIRSSWMKVSSWLSEGEVAPLAETTGSATAVSNALDALDSLASLTRTESRPARSRLASVKLPGFGRSLSQLTARSAELDLVEHDATTAGSFSSSAAVSYNLQTGEAGDGSGAAELPVEQLQQKLDAMVQPLADMLTAAMLNEPNSAANPPSHQPTNSPSNQLSKVTELFNRPATTLEKRMASDRAEDGYSADRSLDVASKSTAASSDPDELLNSVMADAEDALWQDLARLIDVSTEDVVKASLSGDLSAFESINFDALQSSSPEARDTQDVAATLLEVNSASAPPESGKAMDTMNQSSQSEAATPGGASPCWPSPLVYPLRPPKKRRSLAAVDLPCFSSQEPGPLPT